MSYNRQQNDVIRCLLIRINKNNCSNRNYVVGFITGFTTKEFNSTVNAHKFTILNKNHFHNIFLFYQADLQKTGRKSHTLY